MDSLEKIWFDYYTKVIAPVKPSHIQIRDSRRAFFAGACAYRDIINQGIDNDTPDEEGVDLFDKLDKELFQFAKDVENGRA